MAVRKDDSLQSISIQLDGKNYSYWSYVMKKILRGKSMWGYVSGTKTKPVNGLLVENYATLLDTWEVDNSKVITWINNSVTPSIGAQLAKYDSAKAVWDHLARLYTQSNFAKQYQLETDIRSLQQNEMSIQDFYSAMSALWDQLALTEPPELSSFDHYVKRRDSQRLVQFLMALRHDFEGLRGSILHRDPLPSVDSVVSELLAEEVRLKSHDDKKIVGPSVFASTHRTTTSTGTQNRPHSKVAIDECAYSKQRGHWKSQCPNVPKGKLQTPQNRPPQQQRPSQPNNGVVAPSLDPSLIEQFQKFLALATSSGNGLSSSGPTNSGSDWDRQ